MENLLAGYLVFRPDFRIVGKFFRLSNWPVSWIHAAMEVVVDLGQANGVLVAQEVDDADRYIFREALQDVAMHALVCRDW